MWTRWQPKAYSEVAVSIRSFCKLLKRTSYEYFCDFASAIWGINAGWSISWYNKESEKQNLHYYAWYLVVWENKSFSNNIEFKRLKINKCKATCNKPTKTAYLKSLNSSLIVITTASWCKCRYRQAETMEYGHVNNQTVWFEHNGLCSEGKC